MSDTYVYQKTFDPSQATNAIGVAATGPTAPVADEGAGLAYVYNEDIILAINLALATGRPLLVSGPPGSGKSSLAASVAYWMAWRLYSYVVTARTRARDLQWHFDALRRLNDAQGGNLSKPGDQPENFVAGLIPYIDPGPLWWSFNRASAQLRGSSPEHPVAVPAADPNESPYLLTPDTRAVILIDEIDKADPDVPNDLLVPLGSLTFEVEETHTPVKLADRKQPPLIIITTNGERALPQAFLRRCLTLLLERPDKERLLHIATNRFGPDTPAGLYSAVFDELNKPPQDGDSAGLTPPSTAEYLDTVKACIDTGVSPDMSNPTWIAIRRTTLWKRPDPAGQA